MECSPESTTRARVGWAPPVCPHPWKPGIGGDGRHSVVDGSEGKGTGTATSFSAADPDLTSSRQETACPLGRPELGLGVALCRAALHPQDCQDQQPKPLPKCQPAASRWGRGCSRLPQCRAGLLGSRAETEPTQRSHHYSQGLDWSPACLGCISCLPSTILASQYWQSPLLVRALG